MQLEDRTKIYQACHALKIAVIVALFYNTVFENITNYLEGSLPNNIYHASLKVRVCVSCKKLS